MYYFLKFNYKLHTIKLICKLNNCYKTWEKSQITSQVTVLFNHLIIKKKTQQSDFNTHSNLVEFNFPTFSEEKKTKILFLVLQHSFVNRYKWNVHFFNCKLIKYLQTINNFSRMFECLQWKSKYQEFIPTFW